MNFHHSHFLQLFHTIKTLKLSGLISEDLSFAEYVMLELIAERAEEAESSDVWVADIVKRVEVTPQAVSTPSTPLPAANTMWPSTHLPTSPHPQRKLRHSIKSSANSVFPATPLTSPPSPIQE